MKISIKILFSIFFAIAIGVHIYNVIVGDSEPFWWHCIYFATYGFCWLMIFSKDKNRSWIYLLMSLFPFITHAYYGYLHAQKLDTEFWVCLLVCVLLPLGFIWLKKEKIAIL